MAASAASTRSVVFRVTGLSVGKAEEIVTSLTAIINERLSPSELLQVKYAVYAIPSCDDVHTSLGLVDFKNGVPAFLDPLIKHPLEDYPVETDHGDINFDRHFFGFTQLYYPDVARPIDADIIAITGLDGHAYGSWRGKGHLGRMWLRDFLLKDLPTCRTMIYGYNSKLSSRGIDTIMTYGMEFTEALKRVRNTPELQRRPIIFIAHSFGGIILAHCLVKAKQADEEDHPTIATLHKATYGILFFATPHKGLMIDDIQTMLAGTESHPRTTLLQQINLKSDLLISQLGDFKNLIRDRKIVSFFETEQTRRLEWDPTSQSWGRTGSHITAVDMNSAILELPRQMETPIPLHADHSKIVKFESTNAQGYQFALEKLRAFVEDASKVVSERFMIRKRKHSADITGMYPPSNVPEASQVPKFEIIPNGHGSKILKPSKNMDFSGTSATRYIQQFAAQTLSTSRAPVFIVPFFQDKMFVGRVEILDAITVALKNEHRRAVLAGIGGVGKSQIAIEYCYRYKANFPCAYVFWVHASNSARFEKSYKDIARELNLPGLDDPEVDNLQLVLKWLNNEDNGPWLLIFDNADDTEIFFGPGPSTSLHQGGQRSLGPLASYLPRSRNGRVIVTTRDLRVGERLANWERLEKRTEPIVVLPFGMDDAMQLLRSKIRKVDVWIETEAAALSEALDFLPLAITQAAAFINENEGVTLTDYHELLQAGDSDTKDLLGEDLVDPGRDPEIRNSVLQTWKISFDLIRKQKPRAAEMLSLMALLDRQAVPDMLLRQGNKRSVNDVTAFTTLKAFSLITQGTNTATFAMHRLVQLSTQRWLELEGSYTMWQETALKRVSECCPADGDYESWTTWDTLYPHIKVVLQYQLTTESCQLHRARILNGAGWYDLEQGHHEAAHEKCLEALSIRQSFLAEDHCDLLESLSTLASVLQYRGKFEAAEEIHRRVLDGRMKTLGPEHKATMKSFHDLGGSLASQSNYEEAQEMYRKAMSGREKLLGPGHRETLISASSLAHALQYDGKHAAAEEQLRFLNDRENILMKDHPDALATMDNLAAVLIDQGKFEAAEGMQRRVLDGRSRTQGQEHRDTLVSLHNLAVALERQHKLDLAEVLYQQALDGGLKRLGLEHPDTLITLTNLANVLSGQGKYEAAEVMYRRAMEGSERTLGPEHADTLTSINNVGVTLHNQKKYEAAEIMYRRAIEGRERTLGLEHADTLASINSIGVALHDQKKYEAAEVMYRQAMEGREKTLGPEHADTLTSINSVGVTLRDQKKYEVAEVMYRRAMEGRERTLGLEHADTLTSINSVGVILHDQKKYEAAEIMYQRAMEGRERTLGPEHANTLRSINNVAATLHDQKKYEAAEIMYRRAMEGRERTLGPEHLDTLTSINNVGVTLHNQKKYEAAEIMYRRAMKGRERTLGPEHVDTLKSINNVGVTLHEQMKYEAAEVMYRRAMEGRERTLEPEHADTLTSINNVGIVLDDQKKYEAAEIMYRRAMEGRERTLGPEHADTLTSINNVGIVLDERKKYEAAEMMYRRAMEGRQKTLGLEHADTLTSINNMGLVLHEQKKYEAAEVMYRRAMEGRERTLGPEHADTLTSMNNIARTLYDQKKYEAAEIIYQQVMEGKERTLGLEHADTLTSINNVGVVLDEQKKYEAAEIMYRRAMEGRERTLGPEHADTLTSINSVGIVLDDQKKYEAAEVMYRRAMEGRERTLGPEHADTLTSINNVGDVLDEQKKYEAAEVMYRRAMEGRAKTLGPEHADTLSSTNAVGVVLGKQKFEKAMKNYEEAILQWTRILRRNNVTYPEHTLTLQTVHNLGSQPREPLRDQAKLALAEQMCERALRCYENKLGADNITTYIPALNPLWDLGSLFERQADFTKARIMYSKALAGYEKVV